MFFYGFDAQLFRREWAICIFQRALKQDKRRLEAAVEGLRVRCIW